jgi:hypothetical protein
MAPNGLFFKYAGVVKKTKKDRMRNTDIRKMELGVEEIRNCIQKKILRLFGHVMQMTEERILKKMLHRSMEVKWPRGRP